MEYLAFDKEYHSTEALPYVAIKKVNYALDKADDKEIFIYGEGWVKISKKAKILYADALPENYNSLDIIDRYKRYGYDVLMHLISKRYKQNDCVYRNYHAELTNVLKFGESYDNFVTLIRNLDNECLLFLKEKYGIYKSIRWLACEINEIHCFTIDAYKENTITGQIYSIDYTGHLCSGNVEISLFFGIPMYAHYNSMSHELSLKNMIKKLYKHFPILNKTFENDTELLAYLDGISVKDMISLIYNENIANKFKFINDYKLIERTAKINV